MEALKGQGRKVKALDKFQEIARNATRDELRNLGYPSAMWDELWPSLVLGTGWEGEHVTFELYVPRARPEEADVVSEARVHTKTGAVTVRIHRETIAKLFASIGELHSVPKKPPPSKE